MASKSLCELKRFFSVLGIQSDTLSVKIQLIRNFKKQISKQFFYDIYYTRLCYRHTKKSHVNSRWLN